MSNAVNQKEESEIDDSEKQEDNGYVEQDKDDEEQDDNNEYKDNEEEEADNDEEIEEEEADNDEEEDDEEEEDEKEEDEKDDEGEDDEEQDDNDDDIEEIEEIEEQGEEDEGEGEQDEEEEQEQGNNNEEEEQEQGNNNEENEHLLKNCLMATIRIPIRIDKDGSFDMINHYGEIKIEEISDIPIKSSDSLYTKLLAYIRENPEYLAKIMKDMELKGEDEQEESVTEITPDLFNFSNMKIREKPLNTSFRSKTIKSKNFTKKNYKSDDMLDEE